MKLKFLSLFLVVHFVSCQPKCPAGFTPPSECFYPEDIKDYGHTSTEIETFYNRYVNLLTKADLIIDGDEPGVNLFFGGELSQKVRKLKYFGNSLVTFLEVGLHHVCRERGLTPQQFLYCLNEMNVTADFFDVCEKYDVVDCNAIKISYQPLNGVCVNPDNPYKGAANTPYTRLIPNSFDDSIHEVRSSVHDSDLPSARLISTGLRTLYVPVEFETPGNLVNDFTLFFSSQVIYDIAKTLKDQTWEGNYGFECCECDGRTKIAPRFSNRQCMPIDIPEKDATHRGRNCMNYIRAMVTHDNCKIKEAQFLNSVTHFMDMDFLYGTLTYQEAMRNGGKFSESGNDIHRTIILGDERSAQFPQFFALVVVWVKFHNLAVNELSRLYPDLPANNKFYEARRFVIATYQKVFYSEVLPLLVSARNFEKYELHSKKQCFDPHIDPSIPVEFTASAARFFHNFIQNSYKVNFKNGTSAEILLRNLNDESLGFDELAGVISGLLFNPWNTKDIASEPSNYLFSSDGGPGLDLRALDLQTERDLGIGTYCDALYYFNLTEGRCIKKFSDFSEFISDDNLEFLKYAYEHPCDVDFGVGASMHYAEDGDLLSDIFDHIFVTTFKNLKCGDPFFYTNALSEDQIEFVENWGLSDILCLTIPDLPHIQPFTCLTPGENNTVEACSTSFSLDGWKLTVNPNSEVTNIPTAPPDNNTTFTEPTVPVTMPVTEAPPV